MKILFIPKKKIRKVYHLWTGTDTVCALWSKGSISNCNQSFILEAPPEGAFLCKQCAIKR